MTKYYKNPPPPENYTKPKPPPCPPPPPSREFICNMFGFTESKESISKREEYMKSKDEGIPYDIIGSGIMVADAEDVRKHAKHQFDKCNEYFNKQQESNIDYKVEFEKAIYNLLWVWYQYGNNKEQTSLTHACMGAGENASDFLERHGFGKDAGWSFEPNEKALELMDNSNLDE